MTQCSRPLFFVTIYPCMIPPFIHSYVHLYLICWKRDFEYNHRHSRIVLVVKIALSGLSLRLPVWLPLLWGLSFTLSNNKPIVDWFGCMFSSTGVVAAVFNLRLFRVSEQNYLSILLYINQYNWDINTNSERPTGSIMSIVAGKSSVQ